MGRGGGGAAVVVAAAREEGGEEREQNKKEQARPKHQLAPLRVSVCLSVYLHLEMCINRSVRALPYSYVFL